MSSPGAAFVLCLLPWLAVAACADAPHAAGSSAAHTDAAAADPDGDAIAGDTAQADTAQAVACVTAATCPAPPSPCQVATCHPQLGCLPIALPDGAICDDGDACTPASACVSGACVAGIALACDDDDPCSTDTCAPTLGCQHKQVADGAACDDGNACSHGDACQDGACAAGPSTCQCQKDADCGSVEDGDACNGTLYCDASKGTCALNTATVVVCAAEGSGPCADMACVPKSGSCALAAKNEGGLCDDGDGCTEIGVCKIGQCVAGPNLCACSQDADCAPQEDGDACNGTLYCAKSTGKCVVNPSTLIACPTAGDTSCVKAVCAPSSGNCGLAFAATGTACDDGALCTSGDACLGGQCVGSAATCPCSADAECTSKDDGDLCNGVMFCNKAKGTCEINPATIVVCQTGLDTACVKHLCQPVVGTCKAVNAVESTPCDADGDACTVGDHCTGGVCEPGTDVCACKSDAECAKSDDGDLCNGTMYCDKTSGDCLLNPKTIVKCSTVADTACKKNTCDPLTGTCAPTAVNDFLPCDADGLVCTLNDQCKGGECKAGANICECLGDSDCKDDGDLCNGVPYCDTSKPLFTCATNPKTVVSCPPSGQAPCSISACVPTSGTCSTTLAKDGTDCDDGTACTLGDACKKGSCVAALNIDCDDGNACTLDTCTAKSGCLHLPVAAACSDGDACTTGDSCAKGKCAAGKVLACHDGNACTDDACAKDKGCVYLPNAATCSDGDVCTLGDGCSAGACSHLGKNPCSDGEPCTTDACDPSSGLCSHKPAANCLRSACLKTADCAKGLVCATAIASCVQCTHASQCAAGQACQGGLCVEGKACASFVPCKPLGMVCDPTTGSCVQCLQDGDCGAGKVCQGQRCAPKVVCNTDADCPAVCHLQLKVCADCNAPGDCTGGTCGGDHMCRPGHVGSVQCAGGNLFSPAPGYQAYLPTVCDDGNVCTDGGCALPAGCSQTTNTAACSDGDVCTAGDGCVGGSCAAGKGNACDDGKPCTLDVCATGSGDCSHEVYEGPCSDGNACTLGELCAGGACKNGKALACDDDNVCTSDSCDPKAGCNFAANTLPCDAGVCTTGDVCKATVCVSSGQKRVWESVVAGDKATVVRGVATTADGFYAAVSYGSASQPDGGGLWRLDGQGKVVWKVEPNLGAGGTITAVAVVGGGAVVCGGRCINGKCYQWLGKYSAEGKELANITFAEGTAYTGRWNAVAAAPSGGVVLVGRQVFNGSNGEEQGMVELLGTDLKLKWYSFVGGSLNDALNSVAIAGGDFVVAGYSATANYGNNGLVARINSAGVVVWERTFGGAGKDEFRSVVVMANGDLSLVGVTGSKGKGGDDGWFLRLVGIGEVADDRTFGGAGGDEFLAAIEGSGGGVTLAGSTQGKGTASHGWLVDVDAWGNIGYQRTSGGVFGEDGFHALTAFGGGLLAAGTQGDVAGLSSAAFVRTDSWGHTSCSAAKGCLDLGPSDCDDGNSCTLDGCDGGACNHAPTTSAAPCGSGYCAGATCLPPPGSCLALQKAAPGVRSGVFQLDPDGGDGPAAPFAAWCDQSSHGGGWTLVLKSASASQLFTYESSLWLSTAVVAADQPGFDLSEAKLASYAGVPLKEVRVGLRSGVVLRHLVFGAVGPSLLTLMTQGASSSVGAAAWAGLVPTLSTLQFDNIQEGLNPKATLYSRVRIGAAFQCCGQTPGATIGLGCALGAGSAWTVVGGSRDGTYKAVVPAHGYVFVR